MWSGCPPNDRELERLATVVVVDTHDEWQVTDRRYLSETSTTQLHRGEKAAIVDTPEDALENRRLAG
jgi:hypothetical protein